MSKCELCGYDPVENGQPHGLFSITKQIGGKFKLVSVCKACYEQHVKELELNRQNFNDQFGEKAVSESTTKVDIHKIIDDAMEKKDRSVSIFIHGDSTSVSVYPYSEENKRWIPDGSGLKCPVCGVYSRHGGLYCSTCGEQLCAPEY